MPTLGTSRKPKTPKATPSQMGTSDVPQTWPKYASRSTSPLLDSRFRNGRAVAPSKYQPPEHDQVRDKVDGSRHDERDQGGPVHFSIRKEPPEEEQDQRSGDDDERVQTSSRRTRRERLRRGPTQRAAPARPRCTYEAISVDQENHRQEEDEPEQERMARHQPVEEEITEQETVESGHRRRIQLAEEKHGDECSETHGPAPARSAVPPGSAATRRAAARGSRRGA